MSQFANQRHKRKAKESLICGYRIHKLLKLFLSVPHFPPRISFRREIFKNLRKKGKKKSQRNRKERFFPLEPRVRGSAPRKEISPGLSLLTGSPEGRPDLGIKKAGKSPGEGEEAGMNVCFIGEVSSDLIIAGRYTDGRLKLEAGSPG